MKRPALRIVNSQGENDCGVCAIAMALGLSYPTALKVVFPGRTPDDKRKRNTKTAHIIDAILRSRKAQAWGSQLVKVGKREQLWFDMAREGNRQIAKVRFEFQKNSNWHWVVIDGDMVFDSCEKKPVRLKDYLHIGAKPKFMSYLPIWFALPKKPIEIDASFPDEATMRIHMFANLHEDARSAAQLFKANPAMVLAFKDAKRIHARMSIALGDLVEMGVLKKTKEDAGFRFTVRDNGMLNLLPKMPLKDQRRIALPTTVD